MNRDKMMTQLDNVLPTFYIGSNNSPQSSDKPDSYLVLKYVFTMPSSNPLGSWKYWEVQIYVAGSSILPIDEIFTKVKLRLKMMGAEITDADRGDYFDSTISKYRNTIEFRLPKGEL